MFLIRAGSWTGRLAGRQTDPFAHARANDRRIPVLEHRDTTARRAPHVAVRHDGDVTVRRQLQLHGRGPGALAKACM